LSFVIIKLFAEVAICSLSFDFVLAL